MAGGVAVSMFIAIALFESLFPARAYLKRFRHIGKNGLFSIINSAILAVFGATINLWVFSMIDARQLGILNALEPPFWLSAMIASIAFDAWIYGWHRMNHQIPALWRFHQVHHSDTKMDISTGFRFHPGEILISSFVNIPVFIALGISLELIVVYKIVFNINVLFHHSNVNLPEAWDRIYRSILVSPNMHRVHHSMRIRETNSNYSSMLTIWDRLFGTYRKNDPKNIVFGLEYDRDADSQGISRLLARPFRPNGSPSSRAESE